MASQNSSKAATNAPDANELVKFDLLMLNEYGYVPTSNGWRGGAGRAVEDTRWSRD
jgi:hypothetical protein